MAQAVLLPSGVRPSRHSGDIAARIVRDIDPTVLTVPFRTTGTAEFLVPTMDVNAIIGRGLMRAFVHPFPKVGVNHCSRVGVCDTLSMYRASSASNFSANSSGE
jgi:hypothetical protein